MGGIQARSNRTTEIQGGVNLGQRAQRARIMATGIVSEDYPETWGRLKTAEKADKWGGGGKRPQDTSGSTNIY